MRQPCFISAVIPCFNGGATLPGAVQSILDQGVPEAEVLIVDDASTDDSAAVAALLARSHPQVRVLLQDVNLGPAVSRNSGLREAMGRFVCFLDADDTYAPGFFRVALPQLESHTRMAALVTGIELINCQREIHSLQMKAVVMSSPSNLLIRRSVAELLGGLPENPVFRGVAGGEDATFRRALGAFFHVAYCDQKFLRYLIKPGSHLDYFLDRSAVVEGKLVLMHHTEEEESKETTAAIGLYFDAIRHRLSALKCLRDASIRRAT